MRPLILFFLLAIVVFGPTWGARKLGILDFHEKTVGQFNQARRIIASGSIENLARLIRALISTFSKDAAGKIPSMGPASNMYKMRWSREMEQVAIRLYQEKTGEVDSEKMPRTPTGYRSFVWMGSIIELIKTVLSFLPDSFAESLTDFLEMVETIIIALWMGVCYPKHPNYPEKLDPNRFYCAAEALFATRYEIGCFSNLLFGVCVVRTNHETSLFKKGVACYRCPVGSHCEYEILSDGFYEEGELCVAPDPNITMVAGTVNATTPDYDATTTALTSLGWSPNVYVLALLVSCFLLFKSYSRRI